MNDVRKMLVETGCVLEGEFFFALKKRGLVSRKYINLDPILTEPVKVLTIARALIQPFRGMFSCLAAPAIGGIPLVYAAAAALLENSRSGHCHLKTVFAEKDGDGFKFDRMGFEKVVRGRSVLILEDISSTGSTSIGVRRCIENAGGTPVGLSLIWNRGGLTAADIEVPVLHSEVTETVQTWQIELTPPGWGELPLVSDIGHPEYYRDYPGPRISLRG